MREMFLACSRTLDFASTMEDVPAAVDRNRTRGALFDAAERCIIFLGGGKEIKKGEKGRREDVLYGEKERKGEDSV